MHHVDECVCVRVYVSETNESVLNLSIMTLPWQPLREKTVYLFLLLSPLNIRERLWKRVTNVDYFRTVDTHKYQNILLHVREDVVMLMFVYAVGIWTMVKDPCAVLIYFVMLSSNLVDICHTYSFHNEIVGLFFWILFWYKADYNCACIQL